MDTKIITISLYISEKFLKNNKAGLDATKCESSNHKYK